MGTAWWTVLATFLCYSSFALLWLDVIPAKSYYPMQTCAFVILGVLNLLSHDMTWAWLDGGIVGVNGFFWWMHRHDDDDDDHTPRYKRIWNFVVDRIPKPNPVPVPVESDS